MCSSSRLRWLWASITARFQSTQVVSQARSSEQQCLLGIGFTNRCSHTHVPHVTTESALYQRCLHSYMSLCGTCRRRSPTMGVSGRTVTKTAFQTLCISLGKKGAVISSQTHLAPDQVHQPVHVWRLPTWHSQSWYSAHFSPYLFVRSIPLIQPTFNQHNFPPQLHSPDSSTLRRNKQERDLESHCPQPTRSRCVRQSRQDYCPLMVFERSVNDLARQWWSCGSRRTGHLTGRAVVRDALATPLCLQAHRRSRAGEGPAQRGHLLTGVGARQQAVGNARVVTQGPVSRLDTAGVQEGADPRTVLEKPFVWCFPSYWVSLVSLAASAPRCPGRVCVFRVSCPSSPPGECRPRGWALVLLACVSWVLVCGVVLVVFLLRGRRPEDRPFLLQVSPSIFWDFGFLHKAPLVGGTHGRVRRDGSDGWRSPVP